MRYAALACDYDNTVARSGKMDDATAWSLGRVRASGRRNVLVTGRTADDLRRVCEHLDLFDRVVAENGGVIVRPDDGSEEVLAEPFPTRLAAALEQREVPVLPGRVVLGTWRPHARVAAETIADLGYEHRVVINRDAAMIVPPATTKGTGLRVALGELGVSQHNAVAVGDAENDHDLLASVRCAVAVADAVPALRERAHRVTHNPGPRGVQELVDALVDDDLPGWAPAPRVALAADAHGEPAWTVGDEALLVVGGSGTGKSGLIAALVERAVADELQVVTLDAEGDYEGDEGAVMAGSDAVAPTRDEVTVLVRAGHLHVVATLVGVPMDERPATAAALLRRVADVVAEVGHPHVVVVDEAHHVFGVDAPVEDPLLPPGTVLVVPDAALLQDEARSHVGAVVALGGGWHDRLVEAARSLRWPAPQAHDVRTRAGWSTGAEDRVIGFEPVAPRDRQQRHARKWALGDVGPDARLLLTGPDARLALEVRNLSELVRTARGLDDQSLRHHIDSRDLSDWVRDVLDDDALADEIEELDSDSDLDRWREHLEETVRRHYPDVRT